MQPVPDQVRRQDVVLDTIFFLLHKSDHNKPPTFAQHCGPRAPQKCSQLDLRPPLPEAAGGRTTCVIAGIVVPQHPGTLGTWRCPWLPLLLLPCLHRRLLTAAAQWRALLPGGLEAAEGEAEAHAAGQRVVRVGRLCLGHLPVGQQGSKGGMTI